MVLFAVVEFVHHGVAFAASYKKRLSGKAATKARITNWLHILVRSALADFVQ